MQSTNPIVNVRSMKLMPALCLDFDGTIRTSKAGNKFIASAEDIALYPDVEAKLWEYRNNNFLLFGITNQGGVAFGIKSPEQDMTELDATLALFESNPFHIIKTCWHHENGKVFPFNTRSLFRKPDIGMLAHCEFEVFNLGYVVDWNNSLFVGDRPEDEECARRAGIAFQSADTFFNR